jgi:hypothetical protein
MDEMPHELPDPKRIKIAMAESGGITHNVDASVLRAGDNHPWASKKHAVIVLNGDDQTRGMLASRENQASIRRQMVEQLADRLSRPEVMKADIIALGVPVKKPRVLV